MSSISLGLRNLAALVVVGAGVLWASAVQAADTIKVGILHSLSGTMAISETTLRGLLLSLVS